MCDSLPPTADPPQNYHVDNVLRNVGQVVTVYCKNKTVAVVKCLPNLRWNATVPACSLEDAGDDSEALLIIVWVVGGVLLFTLLILIVIIATSRSKTRRSRSPTSSVFHISGAGGGGGGRGRGGDNPAFTRADERSEEWSFHPASDFPDAAQLPSYQEAILNSYITVPATTGNVRHQDPPAFVRANAPPSYRSSQLQTRTQIGNTSPSTTPSTATSTVVVHQSASETIPVTPDIPASNNHRRNSEAHHTSSVATANQRCPNATNQDTITNPTSTTNQTHGEGSHIARATAEIRRNTTQTESPVNPAHVDSNSTPESRRYAQNYPQCFFEEEPPPPYSPGPRNYNFSRSPARLAGNNVRRSMHALPTLHPSNLSSNCRHPRQNQNFRRSFHDRPYRPSPSGSALSHNLPSHESSNTNMCQSRQFDSGFNSRLTHSETESSSRIFPTTHLSSQPNPGHEYSHNSSVPTATTPSSHNRSALTSSVPPGAASPGQPCHVSTISVTGNDTRTYGAATNDAGPLYVIRNVQATPSAPPLHPDARSAFPHGFDVQPLGTSTPLHQSPAQIRRFIPPNHSSPLPITRHFTSQSQQKHSGPHSQRIQSPRDPIQRAIQRQSPHLSHSPHASPLPRSHVVHPREGSAAPLARFEGEYL